MAPRLINQSISFAFKRADDAPRSFVASFHRRGLSYWSLRVDCWKDQTAETEQLRQKSRPISSMSRERKRIVYIYETGFFVVDLWLDGWLEQLSQLRAVYDTENRTQELTTAVVCRPRSSTPAGLFSHVPYPSLYSSFSHALLPDIGIAREVSWWKWKVKIAKRYAIWPGWMAATFGQADWSANGQLVPREKRERMREMELFFCTGHFFSSRRLLWPDSLGYSKKRQRGRRKM